MPLREPLLLEMTLPERFMASPAAPEYPTHCAAPSPFPPKVLSVRFTELP